MDFQEYIDSLGLLELNIIIRDNSSIALGDALDIVRDRVNKNADKFTDVDVKAKMTDFRNGNIYEIFSDRWLKKYNQTSWWNLQLDNVSIQKMLNKKSLDGFSKDIEITSSNGIAKVEIDNPEQRKFNVFTKVENGFMVYAKLEDEDINSFNIVLYDESTFENKKLDCSKQSVRVNYVVIFE